MNKILFAFVFLVVLLPCSLFSQTTQLKSFNEILDALTRGEKVNVVIHYADCKMTSDGKEGKSPDQISGLSLFPYDYYSAGVITKKGFISSSQTNIVYLAGFNGFLYSYIKVRVYDDNTSEITVKYVTVDKFETQMDALYSGEINDGSNGKGVYFFSGK